MSQHWLVKQEPEAYSWSDFVRDGKAVWSGVRNFQARNNLRAMKKGDTVLFYHSVSEKQIVGIAQVLREHYPDATAEDGDWSAVDLQPVKPLAKPVTLAQLKADPAMADLLLVKHSRLSVVPVSAKQYERILQLGETT